MPTFSDPLTVTLSGEPPVDQSDVGGLGEVLAEKSDAANFGDYATRVDDGLAVSVVDTDPDGTPRVIAGIEADGAVRSPALVSGGARVEFYNSRTDPVVAEVDQQGRIRRAVHENPPPANQLSVGEYQTRIDYGGVPLVSGNRVVGVIPATAPTAATTVPEDDIRTFVPDIDLTGAVDESARLKLAHDAAAAAGLRDLYIEGPVLAPAALYLGDVLFRTRTGRGRLIGTYRKRVVPISAAAYTPKSDVAPAHLRRLREKLQTATPADPAIVVIVGDSWTQLNQARGWNSQFEHHLQVALRAQYRAQAENIRIVNRGIGGKTWNDLADNPGVGYPAWYTDQAAPWLDYITSVEQADLVPTTREPDLVMILMGMNHGAVLDVDEIAAIDAVRTAIQGVATEPDIVLVAGPVPSANSPSRGQKSALEARDIAAGYARSYAAHHGFGLIDLARAVDAWHWGYDPISSRYQAVVSDQTVTLPYSWPAETRDFALKLTYADVDFWETGDGILTVPLSPIPGNALILERDSATGNVAYTVNTATGRACVPRTVSDVPGGPGAPILEVSVTGPHLSVRWRTVELISAPVLRGGGQFTPSVGFGGGGVLDVTAEYFSASEPTLTGPSLTDQELYGDDGAGGGNDENHLAEAGRAAVFGGVISATNFF